MVLCLGAHHTHTHAHRHAHTPTHKCARTHTEVHTHTKETNECNSNKKISVRLHLAAKLGQGIGYGECCPRSSQRYASFRTKGTTLLGTSPVPHSMSSMLKTSKQRTSLLFREAGVKSLFQRPQKRKDRKSQSAGSG